MIFLPKDAAAKACGAEAVARALSEAGHAPTRTGSRGMLWLEPLLEVEKDGARIGFGPVTAADIPALVAEGFPETHPRCIGKVEDHPFFAAQTRLVFARCGKADPLDLAAYEGMGGLAGLRRALTMDPADITAAITASGLRGRGGAGFPTGIKWTTVAEAPGGPKVIVANADEGDSGSFADRMLMEGDPYALIEGMAIAALATGATQGFIYLRSEYPDARDALTEALARARAAGMLGASVLGDPRGFDIALRMGAGAYVCGEETSLLNSLEGKRGVVRAKPPLPALEGFMGRPTVVNNVITLASAPSILADGPEVWAALGKGRSTGTVPIQIAGNVAQGGLFEAPFGMTLGEIIALAGGTATGRPVKAAQVGGPLGAWFPPSLFDTPFTYEDFDAAGGLVGHAGVTLADEGADMADYARFAMEFCAEESCGKCTPCRIGSTRGVELIDRLGDAQQLALLEELCDTMELGSLCAMGSMTPIPVRSAVEFFPEDFEANARYGGRK